MKRKPLKEMVSKDTWEAMKEQNIVLSYAYNKKSRQGKYLKAKHVEFFIGFDLLENMIVARSYIQKRYKITINMLEILLYLGPKQFFTQADYAELPKQFKYQSIHNLMDTGFVSVVQTGEHIGKNIYRVNNKGSEIIRHFYEVLSGEKKFNERASENPLARKTGRSNFDKKKMDLIQKLNQIPAPEKKKPLYR